MKKGKIFILSGPSGVGKKTVRELLDMPKLHMVNSVSWTTRAPRDEDIEGVTYHFATREEFERLVEENGFVEHAGYADKAYGTPRAPLEKWIEEGTNVMLEIEVQGAAQVMKQFPEAVSIFLIPPTIEELRRRLTGRASGESAREIEKRMNRAAEEMKLQDQYQYVVENDTPLRAAAEMEQIILDNIKSV